MLEVPEGRSFAKGEVLTEKPATTRGDVVKLLDEQGLLPVEAPKREEPADEAEAEPEAKPDPTEAKPRARKPRSAGEAASLKLEVPEDVARCVAVWRSWARQIREQDDD